MFFFFGFTQLCRFSSNSSANSAGLCKSSLLKVADFSYNFFVGNIPKCLEHLPRYILIHLGCFASEFETSPILLNGH